jgi:hypothetical protein
LDPSVRRRSIHPEHRTAAPAAPLGSPNCTMVLRSTLRETVVLVIFGIVLVPIAAKRAQDAPGYWKAFANTAQQCLIAHGPEPLTPASMLTSKWDDDGVSSRLATNSHTAARPTQKPQRRGADSLIRPQQNGTASLGSKTGQSRSHLKRSITFRFQVSKKPEGASHAAATEFFALLEALRASKKAVLAAVDGVVPPHNTTTSAANRERWTLIWMGTAIAAVAVFMMSFC